MENLQQPSDKEKDIELILNSQVQPAQKIEAMSRHVSTLLAFPFTVAKVLHLTQDPKSGAAQLAQAIEADPVIAAHLLKVSNSVFFASANRRIDTIKDAIVRIGFQETKKIAMGMSVMNLFDEQKKSLGFDRIDFWYHSVSCAIVAEHIAKLMGDVNAEHAFLAGLLHDLGIIIMDEFLPAVFDEVLQNTAKQGGLFMDRETAMLGVSHNDLLADLFERWKIPHEITEGIVQQYNFRKFQDNFNTPGKKLALCVAIGNVLSKTLHVGRECDEYVQPLKNWVLQQAKINVGFSENFIDKVYQGIEEFRRFLNLEQREYPREFTGMSNARELCAGIFNPGNNLFVPPLLYLKKEGFTVEVLSNGKPASAYDSKLDLVIIWADADTSVNTVLLYCSIVKRNSGASAGAGAIVFAPVLVIAPSDWVLPDNEKTNKISLMRDEFDLRQLDKTVCDVVAGNVIRPVV
ncbi:MAG: HDOD domain-containing protein [Chitinivibrionales bacterium]|nr:HDOD domain-containing protein [Chitinivibrionales bacterium]